MFQWVWMTGSPHDIFSQLFPQFCMWVATCINIYLAFSTMHTFYRDRDKFENLRASILAADKVLLVHEVLREVQLRAETREEVWAVVTTIHCLFAQHQRAFPSEEEEDDGDEEEEDEEEEES